MVRNNTILENTVKRIDQNIDQLLHTRKVIEGILNDLTKLDSGEPAQPNHLIQEPAPSLLTDQFVAPSSPNGADSAGVPSPFANLSPAHPYFDEFSPLQAERVKTSYPLCQFNQGDYVTGYSPQPAGVSYSQLCKEYCNSIVTLYRRAFRQLRQAALYIWNVEE